MPLVCWCYAVQLAVNLLNMRMAYNGMSMHESFYGTRLSNECTIEFGQVVLCRATRAHAELTGGWSVNKNAFFAKFLGFDPHRPNKFTVVAKNHRVHVVTSLKAYPDMFSFQSLFRRYPSVLEAPVQWDAARSEGNSQAGGTIEQDRPAQPGRMPEGAKSTENHAPANGDRHQPNVSRGDKTPEENELVVSMPDVQEMDIPDIVDNPEFDVNDEVVAPLPPALRRSSRRNAGQQPGNFYTDMATREQFGELGLKGSVGGIASRPPTASIGKPPIPPGESTVSHQGVLDLSTSGAHSGVTLSPSHAYVGMTAKQLKRLSKGISRVRGVLKEFHEKGHYREKRFNKENEVAPRGIETGSPNREKLALVRSERSSLPIIASYSTTIPRASTY